MLVYVSVIMIVMARQFSRLESLEEDINRCVVVDKSGQTNMKTVRLADILIKFIFSLDTRFEIFSEQCWRIQKFWCNQIISGHIRGILNFNSQSKNLNAVSESFAKSF